MKIGIHISKGSFSDRWIEYCETNRIKYKTVNAYDSQIVEQLADCDGLMWHWHHGSYRDQLFARQLTLSLEASGKLIFPNSRTAWHFDDKLGQKYLFEALNIPTPKSYIFYDRESALRWASATTFPKVFKVRGGASAHNVKLVENNKAAKKIIDRAFSKGFSLLDRQNWVQQAIWNYKRDGGIENLLRIIKQMFIIGGTSDNERLLPIQKGYAYFQDFIANNTFDDRLVVIGNRCFCLRRYTRTNDFRASGSGVFAYEIDLFPINSVELAFNVAQKIQSQSLAVDIVYDEKQRPLIIEVSYAFVMGSAYDNCHGFYDRELNWHDKQVNPQVFMIEDFIEMVGNRVGVHLIVVP